MAWGNVNQPHGNVVTFDDGTMFNFTRRERPHIIQDSNGRLTHLVNAVQYGVGLDPGTGAINGDASYTYVQPVQTKKLRRVKEHLLFQ